MLTPAPRLPAKASLFFRPVSDSLLPHSFSRSFFVALMKSSYAAKLLLLYVYTRAYKIHNPHQQKCSLGSLADERKVFLSFNRYLVFNSDTRSSHATVMLRRLWTLWSAATLPLLAIRNGRLENRNATKISSNETELSARVAPHVTWPSLLFSAPVNTTPLLLQAAHDTHGPLHDDGTARGPRERRSPWDRREASAERN